jgi:hypothetical protein
VKLFASYPASSASSRRAVDNALSPGVDLAGRKFEEHLADRIAELAHGDELAVGKDRHHERRAGMHDEFALREAAVRKAHGVAADVQQHAVEHRHAG